jgi:hypothetical protein
MPAAPPREPRARGPWVRAHAASLGRLGCLPDIGPLGGAGQRGRRAEGREPNMAHRQVPLFEFLIFV